MLKAGTTVRVSKISPSTAPIFRTAEEIEWKSGEHNKGITLPINYTVEGVLVQDLGLHNNLTLARTKRNSVEAMGIFQTSRIQSIEYSNKTNLYTVETENSVYVISILKEAEENNVSSLAN